MSYKELEQKKLFLLDMDGTIYLDNKLFNKSLDFLNYINEMNGKYIFITNNSSKSVDDYIIKLNSLDIKADRSNFLTSTQATVAYLLNHYNGKRIYALGTQSFKNELKGSGLNITDVYSEGIDCLVVGFDTELSYNKLVDACRLLTDGVDYIATNLDLLCPTSFGFVPDCGSICHMLNLATGREPMYMGKPNAQIVELALANTRFKKKETIVIGDRLYTDIACGINAGVTTGVVLTGEARLEDIKDTEFKPDYVFKDIAEILEKISYKALESR